MSQSQGKKADPDQHARFLETARALGCDEDEAAFDEKLKGIVVAGLSRAKISDCASDKPEDSQKNEGPRQRKIK